MLGMRDEEAFIVFITVVAPLVALVFTVVRLSRSRERKLKSLESILKNGQFDVESQRQLVQEIIKPGLGTQLFRAIRQATAGLGARLLAGSGWIGIFLGIGFMLSGDRDLAEMGIPFALVSFGVLTLPFALRELDAKRPTAASRRAP